MTMIEKWLHAKNVILMLEKGAAPQFEQAYQSFYGT